MGRGKEVRADLGGVRERSRVDMIKIRCVKF